MTNPLIQFNPQYKITIFTNEETIIIDSTESFITCSVNVVRNLLSETNQASVELYNLAPETRTKIFQDQFYDFTDETKHKYIHIEAGYNGATSLLFAGRILQSYSFRQGGSTDVISSIQAMPFDIFNNQSSITFAAGTTYKEAIKRLASDLPNCSLGDLGSIEGTFKTPTTFDGNTFECINTITQGHSFVDNGKIHTLMDNEVSKVPVPVISNDTTLLETPIRKGANLEITSIFLPDIRVGQLIEIASEVAPNFDGQYKLVGFSHSCLFSETQAGQRITKMTLWIAPMLPGSNIALTQDKDINVNSGNSNSSNILTEVEGEKTNPVNINEPASVTGVYSYLQENNGKLPNTKITKNITWADMLGHNNTDAERLAECTIGVLTNVYNTAQTLQKIINTIFSGSRIIVNSGWRSVRNNLACGGNPKSKHLQGLAIDFKLANFSANIVGAKIASLWNGYTKIYPSFIHVQVNSGKGKANDV